MESSLPVQMNTYQSKTYRKDLNWPHFDNEPRIRERQCAGPKYPFLQFTKHIQIAAKSTNPDIATVSHERSYGRFIEIKSKLRGGKKLQGTNRGSNSFKTVLAVSNVRGPTKIRIDRQAHHLNPLMHNVPKSSDTL